MTKKGSGYLSLHAMRPIRSPFWRRGIGKALRFIARFLMWFGGLPLALGRGTGSELRRPLGITIVGGLIVSQCLTLFTTPVVYLFFDRLRTRTAKLATRK